MTRNILLFIFIMEFDRHQMINDIQAELVTYLEDKNLKTVFVSIVEAILLHKPDNPIGYMVHFLKDNYPEATCSAFLGIQMNSSKCLDTTQDSDASQSESDGSQTYSIKEIGSKSIRRRASISAEKLNLGTADTDLIVTLKSEDEASRINAILTTNILFRHLDDEQKRKIRAAMFPVIKGDNDVIIKQGDVGDNFYIIEDGKVEVFIEAKDQTIKQVASYSVGDSFGELAIMYNAPRAATCIAKGNVRLWALDRVSFKLILLETTIEKRIEYTNFLKQVPVLQELNDYEFLTIADALEEDSFSDQEVICTEGDQGDRFYLIRNGTAICYEQCPDGSIKELARLTSGAYFGEVALMTSKGRQATVVASGELKCLSLDRKAFKRVMGSLENTLLKNMVHLSL